MEMDIKEKINILFDNFSPEGPLPNLLDSKHFTKEFITGNSDTVKTFIKGKLKNQIGISFSHFCMYFLHMQKVNFLPSYLCNTTNKWIYPVAIGNAFYCGQLLLAGESPYILDSFIPKKVYECLLNKKGFLMLVFEVEIVPQKMIDTFLYNTKIPHDRIIIQASNTITFKNFSFSIANEIHAILKIGGEWNNKEVNALTISEKSIKFNCINRVAVKNRPSIKFRVLCSALLLQDNLTENSSISIGTEENINLYEFLEEHNTPNSFHEKLTNKILNNKKDLSKFSDWVPVKEVAKSFFAIVLGEYFEPENYKESEIIFITEKIYSPIKFKQFFIYLGRPHTLKLMKSMGYKTFDSIIDERYDEEQNDEVRFLKIYKEIHRICSMDTDQVKNLSQKVNSILEFNYNHMYTRINQSLINVEKKFHEK